jgi:hypothetical protein
LAHFRHRPEGDNQFTGTQEIEVMWGELRMPLKNKAGDVCINDESCRCVGGEVNMPLLINAANELLGLLLWTWIDVAQETIQREGASTNRVGRVFDGLWWHTHLSHHFNAAGGF